MKYLFAAALAASVFASFSAANAAGGCGPGYHPNRYGECRPNRGVVVIEQPEVIVRRPVVVERRPAVIVVPRVGGCPYGFVWRYGRCRPY